ncbi:MAG: hypothetical protein JWN73_2184 [Betaproteobacteria bacterium]|nr:hypothetical protein [Betaproteobacteria bacterium]
MFKVLPDGSIETTTLEEALAVQAAIKKRDKDVWEAFMHANPDATVAKVDHVVGEFVQGVIAMGRPQAEALAAAKEFISKLEPLKGKELSVDELIPLVGAASQEGVGPKLRALKNTFHAAGSSLNHYLVGPTKDANGKSVWLVLPDKL